MEEKKVVNSVHFTFAEESFLDLKYSDSSSNDEKTGDWIHSVNSSGTEGSEITVEKL